MIHGLFFYDTALFFASKSASRFLKRYLFYLFILAKRSFARIKNVYEVGVYSCLVVIFMYEHIHVFYAKNKN